VAGISAYRDVTLGASDFRVLGDGASLMTSSTGMSNSALICPILLAGIALTLRQPRTVVLATSSRAANATTLPAL
jgi:hypothetical protein